LDAFVFDLVDISQRKIVAVPKNLQIVHVNGDRFFPLESLEETYRIGNSGRGGSRVEYPLNADGIVEERFMIRARWCAGVSIRGENTLVAVMPCPGAVCEPRTDVPVCFSFPPT